VGKFKGGRTASRILQKRLPGIKVGGGGGKGKSRGSRKGGGGNCTALVTGPAKGVCVPYTELEKE